MSIWIAVHSLSPGVGQLLWAPTLRASALGTSGGLPQEKLATDELFGLDFYLSFILSINYYFCVILVLYSNHNSAVQP